MSQEFAKARVLPSKQPRKILIIDDEADIREVAAIALEVIAGWQVSEASSGAEGVTVARGKNRMRFFSTRRCPRWMDLQP